MRYQYEEEGGERNVIDECKIMRRRGLYASLIRLREF